MLIVVNLQHSLICPLQFVTWVLESAEAFFRNLRILVISVRHCFRYYSSFIRTKLEGHFEFSRQHHGSVLCSSIDQSRRFFITHAISLLMPSYLHEHLQQGLFPIFSLGRGQVPLLFAVKE